MYICYAFTYEVEATLGRNFPYLKVISPVAYRLELLARWQIHPAFPVSHLKAYIRHPEFEWEVEPPPLVLVDGGLEYEVEVILLIVAREPNANTLSYGRATLCQRPHGNKSLISSMLLTS